MAGLCPGFKHVAAFGEDEEYEEEMEVSYVTLDLGNDIDKTLLPSTSEYRLIGLDTPTPMLQLSGIFFKGAHEELLGTEILFGDGRDDSDPSRRFVVPLGTTEARVQFQRVEITPKEPEGGEEKGEPRETSEPQTSYTRGRRGRGRSRARGRRGGKGATAASSRSHGTAAVDLSEQEGQDL